MSEPTLKLPRGAEELLRELPFVEPDFEAHAQAIEATLGSQVAAAGLSDDDLFRVPDLAAEPGEPSLQVPSTVRAAPKTNFAEMARRSLQKKEDDGTALAKELLAAAAQNRRPDAGMVERVKAAGRASSATASPLPTNDAERTSGVVTRAAAAPLLAATASRADKSPGMKRAPLLGVVGLVVAVAAGVALFVKTRGAAPSPTSVALQAERASEAPAAVGEPHAAPALPSPASGPAVVSPDALPQAVTERKLSASEKAASAKANSAATSSANAGSVKPAATPTSSPKQEVVELAEDPEPAPPPIAEKKAEPAAEPALKPAEGIATNVPLSPSAGAVSTALGAVRSNAQACLAGQTDSVTASVTFAADGHVLSVRAGGNAAACIQAALSKAHIAPFAKESFTASTTIRPP